MALYSNIPTSISSDPLTDCTSNTCTCRTSGSFPQILFAILIHYFVDALMQKSLKHPQVLEMIMELTEKHKIFEIQIILSCSKYVFKEETF